MSLSMMPPCMVARVARWCRLATLTPSTITRFDFGRTRMTSPSLPRSLPCNTRTRSPLCSFIEPPLFQSGARVWTSSGGAEEEGPGAERRGGLGGIPGGDRPRRTPQEPSQDLRCQRDDSHEPLVAQLTANGPEDARAARLLGVVDEHSRVLVEADVTAV